MTLSPYFHQRAPIKKALSQRGLTVQAGEHSEQPYPLASGTIRWLVAGGALLRRAGRAALGRICDACRLANDDVAAMLKDNLRSLTVNYLAQGINASPTTRHFYHQWLATPVSPGLMDHKDMLGWLGDWCYADRHPVSWSVTQSWQTVALGMPRLCSAKRFSSTDVR